MEESIVTDHKLGFKGEEWSVIMEEREDDVLNTFRADTAKALSIDEDKVINVRYKLNQTSNLIVIYFSVVHSNRFSKADIKETLTGYSYSGIWQIFFQERSRIKSMRVTEPKKHSTPSPSAVRAARNNAYNYYLPGSAWNSVCNKATDALEEAAVTDVKDIFATDSSADVDPERLTIVFTPKENGADLWCNASDAYDEVGVRRTRALLISKCSFPRVWQIYRQYRGDSDEAPWKQPITQGGGGLWVSPFQISFTKSKWSDVYASEKPTLQEVILEDILVALKSRGTCTISSLSSSPSSVLNAQVSIEHDYTFKEQDIQQCLAKASFANTWNIYVKHSPSYKFFGAEVEQADASSYPVEENASLALSELKLAFHGQFTDVSVDDIGRRVIMDVMHASQLVCSHVSDYAVTQAGVSMKIKVQHPFSLLRDELVERIRGVRFSKLWEVCVDECKAHLLEGGVMATKSETQTHHVVTFVGARWNKSESTQVYETALRTDIQKCLACDDSQNILITTTENDMTARFSIHHHDCTDKELIDMQLASYAFPAVWRVYPDGKLLNSQTFTSVTTNHSVRFPGSLWPVIRAEKAQDVQIALVEDIAGALQTDKENVKNLTLQGGLLANFDVSHEETVAAAEINERLGAYEFPILWALYGEEQKRFSSDSQENGDSTENEAIVTRHRVRFDGNDWPKVLEQRPEELHRVFVEDATHAIHVDESNILSVDFSLGSLVVNFEVRHPAIDTRSSIDDKLKEYEYPETWSLYFSVVNSDIATTTNTAISTHQVHIPSLSDGLSSDKRADILNAFQKDVAAVVPGTQPLDVQNMNCTNDTMQFTVQHPTLVSNEEVDAAIQGSLFSQTRELLCDSVSTRHCVRLEGGEWEVSVENKLPVLQAILLADIEEAVRLSDINTLAIEFPEGNLVATFDVEHASLVSREEIDHRLELFGFERTWRLYKSEQWTNLRVHLEGEHWETVMSRCPDDLEQAFVEDVSSALEIPKSNVQNVGFSIGSLIADFNVKDNAQNRSKETLNHVLTAAPFANTWNLYQPKSNQEEDRNPSAPRAVEPSKEEQICALTPTSRDTPRSSKQRSLQDCESFPSCDQATEVHAEPPLLRAEHEVPPALHSEDEVTHLRSTVQSAAPVHVTEENVRALNKPTTTMNTEEMAPTLVTRDEVAPRLARVGTPEQECAVGEWQTVSSVNMGAPEEDHISKTSVVSDALREPEALRAADEAAPSLRSYDAEEAVATLPMRSSPPPLPEDNESFMSVHTAPELKEDPTVASPRSVAIAEIAPRAVAAIPPPTLADNESFMSVEDAVQPTERAAVAQPRSLVAADEALPALRTYDAQDAVAAPLPQPLEDNESFMSVKDAVQPTERAAVAQPRSLVAADEALPALRTYDAQDAVAAPLPQPLEDNESFMSVEDAVQPTERAAVAQPRSLVAADEALPALRTYDAQDAVAAPLPQPLEDNESFMSVEDTVQPTERAAVAQPRSLVAADEALPALRTYDAQDAVAAPLPQPLEDNESFMSVEDTVQPTERAAVAQPRSLVAADEALPALRTYDAQDAVAAPLPQPLEDNESFMSVEDTVQPTERAAVAQPRSLVAADEALPALRTYDAQDAVAAPLPQPLEDNESFMSVKDAVQPTERAAVAQPRSLVAADEALPALRTYDAQDAVAAPLPQPLEDNESFMSVEDAVQPTERAAVAQPRSLVAADEALPALRTYDAQDAVAAPLPQPLEDNESFMSVEDAVQPTERAAVAQPRSVAIPQEGPVISGTGVVHCAEMGDQLDDSVIPLAVKYSMQEPDTLAVSDENAPTVRTEVPVAQCEPRQLGQMPTIDMGDALDGAPIPTELVNTLEQPESLVAADERVPRLARVGAPQDERVTGGLERAPSVEMGGQPEDEAHARAVNYSMQEPESLVAADERVPRLARVGAPQDERVTGGLERAPSVEMGGQPEDEAHARAVNYSMQEPESLVAADERVPRLARVGTPQDERVTGGLERAPSVEMGGQPEDEAHARAVNYSMQEPESLVAADERVPRLARVGTPQDERVTGGLERAPSVEMGGQPEDEAHARAVNYSMQEPESLVAADERVPRLARVGTPQDERVTGGLERAPSVEMGGQPEDEAHARAVNYSMQEPESLVAADERVPRLARVGTPQDERVTGGLERAPSVEMGGQPEDEAHARAVNYSMQEPESLVAADERVPRLARVGTPQDERVTGGLERAPSVEMGGQPEDEAHARAVNDALREEEYIPKTRETANVLPVYTTPAPFVERMRSSVDTCAIQGVEKMQTVNMGEPLIGVQKEIYSALEQPESLFASNSELPRLARAGTPEDARAVGGVEEARSVEMGEQPEYAARPRVSEGALQEPESLMASEHLPPTLRERDEQVPRLARTGTPEDARAVGGVEEARSVEMGEQPEYAARPRVSEGALQEPESLMASEHLPPTLRERDEQVPRLARTGTPEDARAVGGVEEARSVEMGEQPEYAARPRVSEGALQEPESLMASEHLPPTLRERDEQVPRLARAGTPEDARAVGGVEEARSVEMGEQPEYAARPRVSEGALQEPESLMASEHLPPTLRERDEQVPRLARAGTPEDARAVGGVEEARSVEMGEQPEYAARPRVSEGALQEPESLMASAESAPTMRTEVPVAQCEPRQLGQMPTIDMGDTLDGAPIPTELVNTLEQPESLSAGEKHIPRLARQGTPEDERVYGERQTAPSAEMGELPENAARPRASHGALQEPESLQAKDEVPPALREHHQEMPRLARQGTPEDERVYGERQTAPSAEMGELPENAARPRASHGALQEPESLQAKDEVPPALREHHQEMPRLARQGTPEDERVYGERQTAPSAEMGELPENAARPRASHGALQEPESLQAKDEVPPALREHHQEMPRLARQGTPEDERVYGERQTAPSAEMGELPENAARPRASHGALQEPESLQAKDEVPPALREHHQEMPRLARQGTPEDERVYGERQTAPSAEMGELPENAARPRASHGALQEPESLQAKDEVPPALREHHQEMPRLARQGTPEDERVYGERQTAPSAEMGELPENAARPRASHGALQEPESLQAKDEVPPALREHHQEMPRLARQGTPEKPRRKRNPDLVKSKHRVGFMGDAWPKVLSRKKVEFSDVFVRDTDDTLKLKSTISAVDCDPKKGDTVVTFYVDHSASVDVKSIDNKLREAPYENVWNLYYADDEETSKEKSDAVTQTFHRVGFVGKLWGSIVEKKWEQFNRAVLQDAADAFAIPESTVSVAGFTVGEDDIVIDLLAVRANSGDEDDGDALLDASEFLHVWSLYPGQRYSKLPTASPAARMASPKIAAPNRGTALPPIKKNANSTVTPTKTRGIEVPRQTPVPSSGAVKKTGGSATVPRPPSAPRRSVSQTKKRPRRVNLNKLENELAVKKIILEEQENLEQQEREARRASLCSRSNTPVSRSREGSLPLIEGRR